MGLAAALNVQQPWVETIFWFDARTGTAAAAAAASLGMTRVLTFEDLITWVGAALESLVGVARAPALMRAQREMPPLPIREPQVCLPLPEAERRFREIYLRRILLESPQYSVAAQRAGVPYTTLCSMVKKLKSRVAAHIGLSAMMPSTTPRESPSLTRVPGATPISGGRDIR